MGQHFPTATYRDAARVAKKLGFVFLRMAKGDHEIWGKPLGGRYTTIPNWGSKNLKRKTLKGIIEDFEITPEEFLKLRHGKN